MRIRALPYKLWGSCKYVWGCLFNWYWDLLSFRWRVPDYMAKCSGLPIIILFSVWGEKKKKRGVLWFPCILFFPYTKVRPFFPHSSNPHFSCSAWARSPFFTFLYEFSLIKTLYPSLYCQEISHRYFMGFLHIMRHTRAVYFAGYLMHSRRFL